MTMGFADGVIVVVVDAVAASTTGCTHKQMAKQTLNAKTIDESNRRIFVSLLREVARSRPPRRLAGVNFVLHLNAEVDRNELRRKRTGRRRAGDP